MAGTLTCSGLPREACSSLAETVICFAGCIICQNVMSSRPWEAAAMQRREGVGGPRGQYTRLPGPSQGPTWAPA